MNSKVIVACVLALCSLSINLVYAIPPEKRFIKTTDGVIVYPYIEFSGNTVAVRLRVINDKIIRIIAAPAKEIAERESLITVYASTSKAWTLTENSSQVIIKTPYITATVTLKTGAVSYADKDGKPLLRERSFNGRRLLPAIFDGQKSYGLSQTFTTTGDDAYYGLGQHQDDLFNYKGQQVNLFQNNTEVAIPFLVSRKNYGILWDNYSLTQIGDTRSYHPLSSFRLYSKKDEEGWLTATYSNDKSKPGDKVLERAESAINMEFLNDSKLQLPPEFKPADGLVTWEGSIASEFTGMHKLRFTYGGYIKVWLNGQLRLDRWRKAWNPAPALLELNMQKSQRTAIKIEWIPEGTESYISFKWIEPLPTDKQNEFGFSSEAGQQLDYYFIYGKNMDEVISGYRVLTGKATIVPKWAMGFWQSRERYKTQDEILNTIAEFRKKNIPIDNIVLDWSYWKENDWGSQEFDATRFPSPDSMIKTLHEKYNTQIMISVWPKFYEGIASYNKFDKKGWLFKRNIADRQRDWIGKGYVSTFYDAFNASARKGFWDLIHKNIYTKGFDAWWMDASEPDILSNVSPEKRKLQMTPTSIGPAAENLNAYPLQNAKGIYEGQRSSDPGKRVFLLTRSGFAGSQRYAAAIWSGDIGARWDDMKAQISAGINFSLSGVPYWTMDVGGFVVENRYLKPNDQDLEEWREMNTRWYQFGAFVPLFRVHGQFPYREIFNIAPESHPAYQSMLYYDKLRYRLLPYSYTLAGMTHHDNYTIMRALVMDFANDTAVTNIGDQFMFGPSLLVNPVYNFKERKRNLYLPAGQGWYDMYSGRYFKGGQHITADAPLERMPVFAKEGSIVPFGPELQYTSQKKADTVTLFVYTGKDASFKLYEDEGTNYNYEKGRFANIPINYNEALKQLTIGAGTGSFDGMLTDRVFKIVWITHASPKGMDEAVVPSKEVLYHGKTVIVKMQ